MINDDANAKKTDNKKIEWFGRQWWCQHERDWWQNDDSLVWSNHVVCLLLHHFLQLTNHAKGEEIMMIFWHLRNHHEHGQRFITYLLLHMLTKPFSRTWPSRREKLIWRFIQLDFRTNRFDLICVIMDNFRDCFQSLDSFQAEGLKKWNFFMAFFMDQV